MVTISKRSRSGDVRTFEVAPNPWEGMWPFGMLAHALRLVTMAYHRKLYVSEIKKSRKRQSELVAKSIEEQDRDVKLIRCLICRERVTRVHECTPNPIKWHEVALGIMLARVDFNTATYSHQVDEKTGFLWHPEYRRFRRLIPGDKVSPGEVVFSVCCCPGAIKPCTSRVPFHGLACAYRRLRNRMKDDTRRKTYAKGMIDLNKEEDI